MISTKALQTITLEVLKNFPNNKFTTKIVLPNLLRIIWQRTHNIQVSFSGCKVMFLHNNIFVKHLRYLQPVKPSRITKTRIIPLIWTPTSPTVSYTRHTKSIYIHTKFALQRRRTTSFTMSNEPFVPKSIMHYKYKHNVNRAKILRMPIWTSNNKQNLWK